MKKVLTFLFLIFSQYVLTQTKTLPGYYINLASDTVTCQIFFKDWTSNPTEIKVRIGNTTRNLEIKDMLGFGVNEKTHYLKKKVTYHLNPISGLQIPDQFSDSVTTNEFFLKVVRTGKYKLYELVLPERDYFFIENNEHEVEELIYRVRKLDTDLAEDEQYKQQLYKYLVAEGLANNYNWVNSKISYSAAKIGSIVSYINGKSASDSETEIVKPGLSLELKAGAFYNFFPTKFMDPYRTTVNMPASISPSVGIDFIFGFPGKFQRAGLGLGASYNHIRSNLSKQDSFSTVVSSANYSNTKYKYSYRLNAPTVFANFYGFFIFNPTAKLKVSVNGGLSYHFTLRKGNDVKYTFQSEVVGVRNGNTPYQTNQNETRDVIDVTNGWFNFNAGLGCAFQRHKLTVLYVIPGEVTARTNQNNNFFIGSIGLFYHFQLLSNK